MSRLAAVSLALMVGVACAGFALSAPLTICNVPSNVVLTQVQGSTDLTVRNPGDARPFLTVTNCPHPRATRLGDALTLYCGTP